ncbi:hypothetical protein KF840_23160 [bacterium]|nr:hypothetical protein [bacterium]
MSRKLLIGMTLAALAAPSVLLAALPKAEQICINKINSDGVKVQAAQLKVSDGCVAAAVKTQLNPGPSADACIDTDPKGAVNKKRQSTTADITKKCSGTPSMFFAGATITNDAAQDGAKDLARDVFGAGMSALKSCDTNARECACQVKVINRVSKLSRAMGKIWLQCKKNALTANGAFAPSGATTNAQLEQCVTNAALASGLSVAADTKGKIANAKAQLQTTAGQFCGSGSVDEFAGGACAGFSTPPTIDAAGLATCLANQAKCRFCEMINETDVLAIDCDTWVGITCP